MSRGKRFESARRLSRTGLPKRNTRNKKGSHFDVRKLFDTTHKFIWWIERKRRTVLDQPQISTSTLGEAAKSLCGVGLSAPERCDLDATRRGSVVHLPKLYSLDCRGEGFSELPL
jgi:hypothetical protein